VIVVVGQSGPLRPPPAPAQSSERFDFQRLAIGDDFDLSVSIGAEHLRPHRGVSSQHVARGMAVRIAAAGADEHGSGVQTSDPLGTARGQAPVVRGLEQVHSSRVDGVEEVQLDCA